MCVCVCVCVCLCRWIAFTDLLQKAKPVKLYKKAVDPVFHRKPVLGEIREDQTDEGGSSSWGRLPKADSGTGDHYQAGLSNSGGIGEALAAVLPLVRHALEACADNGEAVGCRCMHVAAYTYVCTGIWRTVHCAEYTYLPTCRCMLQIMLYSI